MTLMADVACAHGVETRQVALVRRGAGGRIWADGAWHEVELRPAPGGAYELRVGGVSHAVHVVQRGDEALIHACGRAWTVRLHDPVRDAGAQEHEGDLYAAPMPGTVVEVKVAPGEAVAMGQVLAVMESMKMQVSLEAARDGVVAEVRCAPGDLLDRDAVLVRLAPREA